jgi:hypothetical protein
MLRTNANVYGSHVRPSGALRVTGMGQILDRLLMGRLQSVESTYDSDTGCHVKSGYDK